MNNQTLANRKNFVKVKQIKGSNMQFLPDGYKAPMGASRYMKLKEGENKFRILSQPIFGWEDWQDKTPIRYRMGDGCPTPADPKKPPKHFWAFIVWNYDEKKIQVLSITQATIRKSLESFSKDADWGAPYFYDIKIYKSGQSKDTEYSVTPLPHKDLNAEIELEFYSSPCNLEALFTNEDPFSYLWQEHTPGMFSKREEAIGRAG
jgi:hypothetical protein